MMKAVDSVGSEFMTDDAYHEFCVYTFTLLKRATIPYCGTAWSIRDSYGVITSTSV